MLKIAYFLRKIETSWVNNLRILGTKNVKFSGYYFKTNTNIQGYFQICIGVPLRTKKGFIYTCSNLLSQQTPHTKTFFPLSLPSQT